MSVILDWWFYHVTHVDNFIALVLCVLGNPDRQVIHRQTHQICEKSEIWPLQLNITICMLDFLVNSIP